MKTNASIPTPFLFNPDLSFADRWREAPRVQTRRRGLALDLETQIDYKQEFICGAILILCLLFGLAAFVAQFAVA